MARNSPSVGGIKRSSSARRTSSSSAMSAQRRLRGTQAGGAEDREAGSVVRPATTESAEADDHQVAVYPPWLRAFRIPGLVVRMER
ncbi:hypothetical protein CFC21_066583 [Triticum aestivum]|uniref:Uncharacterized protein n=3 Tax=Triticum TaxID=4564 RepID=A0A9R0TTX3_TRITD|nr:hypothetical protein CFC21_066583 [Triticum aestivum]VAI19447.1 unnamed protein product [Triticum turgidum subsp. durum]